MRSRPTISYALVVLATAMLQGCSAPASGDSPEAGAQAEPAPPTPADYVETIRGSGVRFDMIWIEAGGFWIGATEVTWDEYLQYCAFESDVTAPPGVDAVSKPSKPLETFPYDRDWGTGKRPAVGMSWNGAQQYCAWLSLNTGRTYRLPTEAEWELACGAAPAGPLDEYAWYSANTEYMTQEVASKLPNEYGLYDILGNVCEYTADPFDENEPEWAALRGGSFLDPAKKITPTYRMRYDEFWNLSDPNDPPGVWWSPDGEDLGLRVLCPGDGSAPEARDGES